MLRISVETDGQSSRIRLEGKLAGPWVEETERVWRAEAAYGKQRYLQVDLSEVTFVDDRGKDLLQQIFESGVDLVAGTLLSRSIVDEIIRNLKGRKRKRQESDCDLLLQRS